MSRHTCQALCVAQSHTLCLPQVLQYSKSRKHVGPLWFSTISTNIMWWTYVKAFWRAVMTAMGFQRIQFKTTLKVRRAVVFRAAPMRRCYNDRHSRDPGHVCQD